MAANHPKPRVIKIFKELANSFDEFYVRDWEHTRTVMAVNDYETIMLTIPAPAQKLAEGETWHIPACNYNILEQLIKNGTVIDGPFAYYTELPQKAQNRYEKIQNILATDATDRSISMTRDNFRLLVKRLYNADCDPNEDKIVIVDDNDRFILHSTEGKSLLITIAVPKSSQNGGHVAAILPHTVFAFIDKLLTWSCNVTLIPGDNYLLITTPNFYYLFEYIENEDTRWSNLYHSYEAARDNVKHKVKYMDVITVTRKEFETSPTKFVLLNDFLKMLAKRKAFHCYEPEDVFHIQCAETEYRDCSSKNKHLSQKDFNIRTPRRQFDFIQIYMTCSPAYGYPVEVVAIHS